MQFNDPKNLFDIIRYILGVAFLLAGLYIFIVRGEEPSIFFWATGNFLIGAQYVLDWFLKWKK